MGTKEVASKIDSVIIYLDRVMVTRSAEVELKSETDIVFADLPGGIDDQSVRVKAKGLKIGEVQVKPGYIKKLHPKVKEIEDKIKAVKRKDRKFADEVLVLQEKEKFLQNISVTAPETIADEIKTGKVSPESWREGLKFISDESIGIKKRYGQIEEKRKDLKEKLDALQRELNDIKSTFQNKKSVVFDVHPDGAKKYGLELRYIIYGASWRTYYELRANPSAGKMDLSYFGKISQRTGEDWEDVSLILSTAKPALGGAAPEPYPWYIDLYTPQPVQKVKAAASRKAEAPPEAELLDQEFATGAAEPPPPVEAGISLMYPLPGRHTLKSGEPERKLKIKDESFDAEFKYFIIPRVTGLSYLTGKIKNESDYLFLEGDGGTYVGDDFTGTIYLSSIAPDEEATISFGIDERVDVKRELKKSKVSKGGLVKKATKYEFAYENIIKNFHDKDVKCEIVDQVPIPRNPNLKVGDIKFEPKPTKEEKDLGIYRWEISISAGKEYKIKTSFDVEAPLNTRIEGLT